MSNISFFDFINDAAINFKSISKDETIKLVSHFDADGICSAAIMINALSNEGFKHDLSIIKQLSEETILDLKKEALNHVVFTDLGSGQIELIKTHIAPFAKSVFILDHHSFDLALLDGLPKNITIVNPHMYSIDGSCDVSGAGVTYLFTEAMNEKNKEKAYIALIGATGDTQEKDGFSGLNLNILDTAMVLGQVRKEKGLRWFGMETRSLIYLLTYNSEVFVPGITGSESNAMQFLVSLEIDPKIKNAWKKYSDLTDAEKGILISAIVMKRANEKNPEDILGNRYLLLREPNSSPLRDIKEFATLLNACGRMDKPLLGIGACLNDEDAIKKAIELISEYKHELVSAIRWYEGQDKSGNTIKGENYVIINAQDKVMPSIIGTLASIISNSGELKKGTLILSLARDSKEMTKVSLRMVGSDETIDLREIISKIAAQVNGQSGGHKNAAGAIILTENELKFIAAAEIEFSKI